MKNSDASFETASLRRRPYDLGRRLARNGVLGLFVMAVVRL